MQPNIIPKKIQVAEAMSLNRHARRHLGKLNNVKIPGTRKPFTKFKK